VGPWLRLTRIETGVQTIPCLSGILSIVDAGGANSRKTRRFVDGRGNPMDMGTLL